MLSDGVVLRTIADACTKRTVAGIGTDPEKRSKSKLILCSNEERRS